MLHNQFLVDKDTVRSRKAGSFAVQTPDSTHSLRKFYWIRLYLFRIIIAVDCRNGIEKITHSVVKTISFMVTKRMVCTFTSLLDRINQLSDSDPLKKSPVVLMIFKTLPT